MNAWNFMKHLVFSIAVATDNIIDTVTQMRNRGVEFLRVPTTYYDDLLDRVGEIDEDIEPLKEFGHFGRS
ncbi:MAG: hypothetical protein R2784_10235 [Saprospiraceae bacterium]